MAYIGVSPSNGVRQKHTYTATASQTTFSGAGAEGVSLSYRDSNYVDVYRNGVKLGDADYTATSGTSIVLGEGAAVSDIIEIIVYDVFSIADTVSKADGGVFDGNVTMAGTLGVTGETTLSANLNLGDNDKAIFGAGSDLQIYHTGLKSRIEDIGTGDLEILATNFGVYNHPDGKAYLTAVASDEIRLYYDNGSRLATTSDGILVYGNIANSGGDFRLDTTSSIILDAGGDGQIELADTGTTFGILYDTSNNFGIYSAVQDKDIIFQGNDGGSTINALTLDMSEAGRATFNNVIRIPTNLEHDGDADTFFGFPANNNFVITAGNVNRVYGSATETVINEDSANLDFRVESDTNTHALFVDAGNNRVIFGDSSTINGATGEFVLGSGASSSPYFSIRNNTTSATTSASSRLDLGVWTNNGAYPTPSGTVTGGINFMAQGNDNAYGASVIKSYILTGGNLGRTSHTARTIFYNKDNTTASSVEYMRLDGGEKAVVINQEGYDNDFRVESDVNTHALFVDAGNNRVGLGTSSPQSYANSQMSLTISDSINPNIVFDDTGQARNWHIVAQGTGLYITYADSGGSSTATNVTNAISFLNDTVSDGIVINDDSKDRDFRVESNDNVNMLFVDAGNNRVGIAQGSPVALVDIGGAQSNESLMLRSGDNNTAASGGKQILFGYNGTASYAHNIRTRHDSNNQTNNTISFYTWQPTQAAGDYGNARIADFSSDGVVFNEDSRNQDFRVESDSSTHMLFVDAGNNRVGVGISAPGKTFEVLGDASIFGSPYASNGDRAKLFLGNRNANIGAIFGSGLYFDPGNSAGDAMTIAQGSGAVTIAGSLSKGSGSFKISHPLPEKNETHHLVHSFVEAPQADNIYRGKVDLIAGQATVNIDTVAGMTEGTFVALNREVQCFTSNETGWTAVRGSVTGNILTIEAQDNTCADTISWLVIGERKDQHMYDTEWTDENGKVIVEPLKEQ